MTRTESFAPASRRFAALLGVGLLVGLATTGFAAAQPQARAKTVRATESDYRIALSLRSFAPGAYRLVVVNHGKTIHALEIDGPGVIDRRTRNLAPGKTATLTVRLRRGTYELYCPVDGHRGLGMNLKIHVG